MNTRAAFCRESLLPQVCHQSLQFPSSGSPSRQRLGSNQRAWNGFSGGLQTECCPAAADTGCWLQVQMPYALRNMVVTLVDRKDVAATPARTDGGGIPGEQRWRFVDDAGGFTGRNPDHESRYTTRHALGNATAYKYLRFVPCHSIYTTALGTGVAGLRVEGRAAP